MPSTTYAIDRGCAPFDLEETRKLYPDCPYRFIEALNHYVNGGIETGAFLRAVLENDLCGAVVRASGSDSLTALPNLCGILVFCLPARAHGSKDAVADWLKSKPLDTTRGGLTSATLLAPDEA